MIVFLIFSISLSFYSCESNLTCNQLQNNYFDLRSDLRNLTDSLRFLEKLQETVNKEPACLKGFQLQGYFHFTLNDFISAKDALLKAYELDTLNAFTCYYLAQVYANEGRNSIALSYLIKSLSAKEKGNGVKDTNNDFFSQLNVDYYSVVYFTGVVAFNERQYSASKICFLKINEEKDFVNSSNEYLAAIYAEENKVDSACFYFKRFRGDFSIGELNLAMESLCR